MRLEMGYLKKILLLLLLFVVVACKFDRKKEDVKSEYFICSLKVTGLNDSIIVDSIWKIGFLPGIESVYINKNDSVISIKADKEIVNRDELLEEIENRGAVILETN